MSEKCVSTVSVNGEEQAAMKFVASLELARDNEGRVLACRRHRFYDPGYYVWCGSAVFWEGAWWLFYSRWAQKLGFEAWVTHSEIAVARADRLGEPFVPCGKKILPMKDGPAWGRDVAHNPTATVVDGTLYLALMATQGMSSQAGIPDRPLSMDDEIWWECRNNQRIAVVSADHPLGPWAMPDHPSFDVNREGWDSRLVSNPTLCARPDGGWLLLYKAVEGDDSVFGREVRHGVAVSEAAYGPWHRVKGALPFNYEGCDFPAEDPFVWYDHQARIYRAIVKDMVGVFTGVSPSLASFVSADGFNWKLTEPGLVMGNTIRWEDGTVEMMERVERPQVVLDAQGSPVALQVAVLPKGRGALSYSLTLLCR
ncbi:MAG: glycoside hydrolase family protein [Verrucomicrobiota bacterium JB024]|nr:glycoside hydrolase family protein [Verrucomicrobiota bacterium JB024]